MAQVLKLTASALLIKRLRQLPLRAAFRLNSQVSAKIDGSLNPSESLDVSSPAPWDRLEGNHYHIPKRKDRRPRRLSRNAQTHRMAGYGSQSREVMWDESYSMRSDKPMRPRERSSRRKLSSRFDTDWYEPAVSASLPLEPSSSSRANQSMGLDDNRKDLGSASASHDEELGFTFEKIPAQLGDSSQESVNADPSGSSARGSKLAGRAAALQSRLVGARTVGHILEILGEYHGEMDPLHIATALHRLAKHAPRSQQQASAIARHPLVSSLLDELGLEDVLLKLSSQSRCCVFLGVAKLGVTPPWLSPLMQLCVEDASTFSGHQLATALHALAKIQSRLSAEEPQKLLEALHQEVRRRQLSLGPGGTSGMDTVLIADALARLQVRDDEVFLTLASALQRHLEAGDLQMREVRHAVTAFNALGFADETFLTSVCKWLMPRIVSCSTPEIVALAFALSRANVAAGEAHFQLFSTFASEVPKRLQRQEITGRDACSLLYSLSQAQALDQNVATPLARVVKEGMKTLNGQDLALAMPCLSSTARQQPQLLHSLANRAVQCMPTLSPRQLARLACGFGDASAQTIPLWDSLGHEALARSSFFATPDVLRVLAGMDAAGVKRPEVLRTFWGLTSAKLNKFLAEESLALLKLWHRLDMSLQRERPELAQQMMQNLSERMEQFKRSGRIAPAELSVDLLEWLPQSRQLHSKAQLDQRLVKATLSQLPAHIVDSTDDFWYRLLVALTGGDPEIMISMRGGLQQRADLRSAFDHRAKRMQVVPGALSASASAAFQCAILGFDGAPMRELLRALLASFSPEDGSCPRVQQAALIIWACAEVRAHQRHALRCITALASSQPNTDKEPEEGEEGIDSTSRAVSHIRLAWAALALGGPDHEIQTLLQPVATFDGGFLSEQLACADVHPTQQLAWHSNQHHRNASGQWADFFLTPPASGRSIAFAPKTKQGELGVERHVSGMLQQMRVPHVAGTPTVIPSAIYKVAVWFPQPKAVLDLDTEGDRLASGAIGGAAGLRRQQLRATGLLVHTLDMSAFSNMRRAQRLRAVAAAVSESCPEAAAWLQHMEAKAARNRDVEEAVSDMVEEAK